MVRKLLALCAVFAPIALFACGNSTATTTTGTGGTGGTSSSVGTTSTTATTSTTSTTATTGTGGAPSGACTNAADSAIVADPAKDVSGQTAMCGKTTFGAEPATKDCIVTATGLSDACATCFGDTVGCVVSKCLTPCLADSAGACCAICRAANCDKDFATCSGITPGAPPPPPDGGC